MFSIVDRNDDYVVVNKPPGIAVQAEGDSPGLLRLVADSIGVDKLYPVHRLDKMTSGLIVMAINEQANSKLSAAFRERTVEKYYLAISDKKPKKKQGAIIGDMEKSRRGGWRLLSSKENPAITQFFSQSIGDGKRLFLLKPKTGKTHQLRVALKSIGAPIVGDELYHAADSAKLCDRGYLHAYGLAFPWQGGTKCYRVLPNEGELFDDVFISAMETYIEPDTIKWPKL